MLPVIEKFTGTEYSTAGFVITAILLLGITAFAGYITGKSAAESFGCEYAYIHNSFCFL